MHKIYSDESGYTGADLLHAAQPFFVYSFLTLSPQDELRLGKEIPQIIDSTFGKEKPREIKFALLRKSTKGKNSIIKICEVLAAMRIQAHIAIIEKKFQICTMVVETFFDPHYHPQSPPEWAAQNWRVWLSNCIYETISEDESEDFLSAIKRDDEHAIRAFGKAFSLRLSNSSNEEVRQAGILMESGLSEFYRFGEEIEGAPAKAQDPSSSITAFIPALVHLNKFLLTNNTTAELVCDETKTYGPVLDYALKLAKDPEFVASYMSEFGITEPITRITGRTELSDSEKHTGIQCADIVAGLINHRALEHKNQLTPDPILSMAWNKFGPCIDAARPAHFKMVSTKLTGVF